MPRVTVVDIGMSNTWSVINAFRYLGAEAEATDDPSAVISADIVVLPGVGSFRLAMDRLNESGLAEAIVSASRDKQRKILGICLGMQLLAVRGTEDGDTPGLALIPGVVDGFTVADVGNRKIPHVGFNTVVPAPGSVLFGSAAERPDFYFVHSYRVAPVAAPGAVSTTHYGSDFVAAYEHENLYATQFHPEKSQANGLQLLKNFLDA
ncbi:MAG: imidazole glycerol phosphate synthase subunit HisH, partial [bacterium]|nr:imidazole glycerol phosphate synthase subunit HisH [bacterium]